jgi:hypothetical protein
MVSMTRRRLWGSKPRWTPEYLVKKDELEAASEDINKGIEKERARQDEVATYWEDVEEEGSRKETEENPDDDDHREADKELVIKGDGFEDVPEDTAEEEVMKQTEVPNTWEGIKKEEGFEDTIEDTAEVDKDTVKQNRLSSTGRKFQKPERGYKKTQQSACKELEAEEADTDAVSNTDASAGGQPQ